MKVYRRMNAIPRSRRRGVTLIEMLVTLAVLLLMMALIVQVFQAATGSMNAAQVYQRLDDDLRRFDSTVRGDLAGVTARFTPPLDPKDNLGYFEYIENEFADNDGEDCDDAIRFTARAPKGRPFTGRMWVRPGKFQDLTVLGSSPVAPPLDLLSATELNQYRNLQPVMVSSEFAEVIYFLRNGNLYRRVLLIAPELQSRIVHSASDSSTVSTVDEGTVPNINVGRFPDSATGGYTLGMRARPGALGNAQVSWQGANDLSARPAARGLAILNGNNSVVLNGVGDLTDRHNRFASPRFADDFVNMPTVSVPLSFNPDGVPDDINADNIPDWYPSLYPRVIEDVLSNLGYTNGLWNIQNTTAEFTAAYINSLRPTLGFPYLYRGSYSWSQSLGSDTYIGRMHSPGPISVDGGTGTFEFNVAGQAAGYLAYLNHNPLDVGDNLPSPLRAGSTPSNNLQTYWGFPTWRETLAPEWADPTFQVNQVGGPDPLNPGPYGLSPINAAEIQAGRTESGLLTRDQQLLPPMTSAWRGANAQPFTDGAGANTGFFSGATGTNLWSNMSWEDDLILTNVRSFDIKAFEPALADYADLGWGDDPRITPAATSNSSPLGYLGTNLETPYLFGSANAFASGAFSKDAHALINGSAYHVINQTFAHEGRMPPIRNDYRFDAQFGEVSPGTYSTNPAYNGNVGDDSPDVVRMRRIWDTWSTTYSKVPAKGVGTNLGGFPHGPPFTPPVYPSYPAPYPAPLRGIQIQVRVTDPTNQRIKILTIRQDFTDKL